MLSVAKTLLGDYNLERDVIIHNYLASKWKKKKSKKKCVAIRNFDSLIW